MKVELIYDADCPNITAARTRLLAAFATAGLAPRWQEWSRNDERGPEYARRYGSPTILVNGRDVSSGSAMDGSGACRIYTNATGQMSGVPPLENIQAALQGTGRTAVPPKSLQQTLPTLPAVVIDGKLADCCAGRGPDATTLRAGGLGEPL